MYVKQKIFFICVGLFFQFGISENVKIIKDEDIPELKYLNTSVDPCENFYEYACGNFKNFYKLEEKDVVNQFSILSDEILQLMNDYLSFPNEKNESSSIKKVKTAYKSCIDLNLEDSRKPIPEVILLEENNGMPLLQKNKYNSFNIGWEDIGKMTARYGVQMFFKINVIPFPISISDNLITLEEDQLDNLIMSHPPHVKNPFDILSEDFKNFATNYQQKNKLQEPFHILLREVLEALRDNVNSDVSNEEIDKGIEQIAQFMWTINYKNVDPPKDITPLVSTTVIGTLQNWTNQLFPNESPPIDWVVYLNDVFKNSGVEINENTNIYVNSSYIYNVLSIVKNTDTDIVKNFALIKIILFFAPHSSWRIRSAFNRYLEAKNFKIDSRRDFCANQLLDVIPSDMVIGISLAAGKLYQEKSFDETSFRKLKELVDDVFSTFQITLNTSVWMDDESKEAALKKAKNMLFLFGMPDFSNDTKDLDKFYDNLKIIESDNYGNMQRIRAFKEGYMLSQMKTPRDRKYWDKSPFETNAFYNRANNKIIIPLAMFNPIFFRGKSKLMDYSHLGVLLGHEMTHGFDDAGRKYNENSTIGNLWTNQTLLAFENKTQCFKDQYSNYFVKELNRTVNGSTSLNENLADNGGVKISYTAAKKIFSSYKLESEKFTPEQLFFIGFGTTFCAMENSKYLEYTLEKGYSPSNYRVIGSISNSDYFSKAFNCPNKSKMNPEIKCSLW